MKKGTKITYKSLGRNPDGDNLINLRENKKLKSDESFNDFLDDNKFHFFHATESEIFALNKLEYNKRKFLILEPNPVTFYFSIGYDLVPQLEYAKKQLEDILARETHPNDTSLIVVNSLIFRISSIGVIFSFLAMEAFINQLLPDYDEIKFKNKYVSKDKIQRWASFDEKLTNIIPTVSTKDFCKDHPKRATKIRKLKKLRDELIHLKQHRNDGLASYNNIYQDILNVDLKSLVNNVKYYINYYQPKTIINYNR